ncbi:hypothetical protein C8J56DRAFT_1058358 [Mycena floridula]|nr:hypothetical protein C8J56DRAFT_1058358 [Mycena floridula]
MSSLRESDSDSDSSVPPATQPGAGTHTAAETNKNSHRTAKSTAAVGSESDSDTMGPPPSQRLKKNKHISKSASSQSKGKAKLFTKALKANTKGTGRSTDSCIHAATVLVLHSGVEVEDEFDSDDSHNGILPIPRLVLQQSKMLAYSEVQSAAQAGLAAVVNDDPGIAIPQSASVKKAREVLYGLMPKLAGYLHDLKLTTNPEYITGNGSSVQSKLSPLLLCSVEHGHVKVIPGLNFATGADIFAAFNHKSKQGWRASSIVFTTRDAIPKQVIHSWTTLPATQKKRKRSDPEPSTKPTKWRRPERQVKKEIVSDSEDVIVISDRDDDRNWSSLGDNFWGNNWGENDYQPHLKQPTITHPVASGSGTHRLKSPSPASSPPPAIQVSTNVPPTYFTPYAPTF